MRIFFLGYPGGMGGANTECLHTAKLWRGAGWQVDFIPTWGNPQPGKSKSRDTLDALGCATHAGYRRKLREVPGLAGNPVVAMCNERLAEAIGPLRELGCPVIWVNCMTFCSPWEGIAFRECGPPDACIYQSEFQRKALEELHVNMGHDPNCSFVIRGAFSTDDWPFSPRETRPDKPFVIGRLSRPDRDKWNEHHWRILEAVPFRHRQALAMGWREETKTKCGKPPDWAEVLKPQQITPQEFFGRCHAMIGLNGGARENWPRVGLEAMAAGVPMVVHDAWGWREMVKHGETGYRCQNHQEFAYYLAKLAHEPETHRRIAEAARAALLEFADPVRLTGEWYEVFRATSQKQEPKREEAAVVRETIPARRGPEPAVNLPSISCQCVTYNRPRELAEVIECFNRQTYPRELRELVILDDAGQYGAQLGFQDGWQIVSHDRRFRTLGEKRNACTALCQHDYLAVWDDDDIYLPWHLEELGRAFADGARFVRPARILTLTGREPRPRLKETKGLFHGAWGFSREAFNEVDGYPFIQSGQDQGLMKRLKQAGVPTFTDTRRPSYIYRWHSYENALHLSAMGKDGYARRGEEAIEPVTAIAPAWSRDWTKLAGLEDLQEDAA